MPTKEMDLRSTRCKCCDSPSCGKRKGPSAKKHKPYLEGQKQRVSWRPDGCPNVYNNDYIVKRSK